MSGSRRFRFVQFEFAWALGPEPGRYTIRERLGEPPAYVLVLRTLGAPQRGLLRGRSRPRDAAAEPAPAPVSTSRATLVDSSALASAEDAARWLHATDLGALADDALARLNRVLHAYRAATVDRAVHEVTREQALVVRVGYGAGEEVADGRWDHARELPARSPHGRRRGGAAARAALRPQERLAAVLAGRDAVLACEELALRARADLEAERLREAALQLSVALDAALAELEPWRELPSLPERIDELRGRRDEVRAAAGAALEGGLDRDQVETVRSVLGRIEAALRARTAGGLS